jgi:DNA-binding Xre family transcriptional regulator
MLKLTKEQASAKLAKNLANLINDRQLSVEILASGIGLPAAVINEILVGKPFIDWYDIYRLAQLLECFVGDLIE